MSAALFGSSWTDRIIGRVWPSWATIKKEINQSGRGGVGGGAAVPLLLLLLLLLDIYSPRLYVAKPEAAAAVGDSGEHC